MAIVSAPLLTALLLGAGQLELQPCPEPPAIEPPMAQVGTAIPAMCADCVSTEVNPSPDVLRLDLRAAAEQQSLPIAGLQSVDRRDLPALMLFRQRRLQLIGSGRDDPALLSLCAELRAQGFERVQVLAGGVLRLSPEAPAELSDSEFQRLLAEGANSVLLGSDPGWTEFLPQMRSVPSDPHKLSEKSLRALLGVPGQTVVIISADPARWSRHLAAQAPDRPAVFYRTELAAALTFRARSHAIATAKYILPTPACARP